LPETTDAAAAQFAERLRQEVSQFPISANGESLRITVSIGICGASVGTSGIEALLGHADQALYQAKSAGRNRVVVWRPAVAANLREAAE
jgi:diguanylate cyclase (GGDEF)-like protein